MAMETSKGFSPPKMMGESAFSNAQEERSPRGIKKELVVDDEPIHVSRDGGESHGRRMVARVVGGESHEKVIDGPPNGAQVFDLSLAGPPTDDETELYADLSLRSLSDVSGAN